MLKLYYANIGLLTNESIFQDVFEKVNIQRRDKVLRCKHEKDKLRSLMTGYLLRNALENENIVYDEALFVTDANGKPFLKSHPELFFSLSHAGEYAVCVISNRSVGVDIETKNKPLFTEAKTDKIDAIAKRILSEEEKRQFEKGREIELFLQFWTRKECYGKSDGRGIHLELNRIETYTNEYVSMWLDEDSCLSIYVEDGSFTDLQIEEIVHL